MRCSPKSHDGRMVRSRIVWTLLSFGTSPFLPSLLSTNLLAPGLTSYTCLHPSWPLRRRHPKRLNPPPIHTQFQLYRHVLQPPSGGAWMHIIGPQNQDTGLWSTGNGWAAAG